MCDILVCRVCLSKDVKLFNIFSFKLAESFEILTGIQATEHDGLPQQICSYCSALLVKSASFKEKCCNTQEFLKYSLLAQRTLSLDYLQSIKKELQLALPYTKIINVLSSEVSETQVKEEQTIEEMTEEELTNETTEKLPKSIIKVEKSPERSPKKKTKKLYKEGKKKKRQKKNDLESVTVKLEKEEEPLAYDNDNDDFDHSAHIDSDTHMSMEDLNGMDVIILTKEQQIQEVQERKTSFNYLNSFFKCDKCYKGFIKDSTYKNHMLRHDPKSGPCVCDVCHVRWPENRALRAHVVTAHERKYVCKLCNHISRSGHRAKEHYKWHNGYTFVCNICGAKFAKSTSYLTHLRLRHPTDSSCEICGESFIGEYGLRIHKRRAHKYDQVFCCENCGAHFFSAEALKRHAEEIKGDQCNADLRPCSRCGEGLPSAEALKAHKVTHSKDIVSCPDCSRTFASAQSLGVHRARQHLGQLPRPQPPLPRLPPQPVVCELCGKQCLTRANLTYHQRTHTGEKPHQCPQCPKRFSVQQRLQIHVRTHTGESPYQCQICPKAFKHKAALNRHDRVHSGAKPYGCPHCGKAFSQSNSMKLHVNTVHLKMPAPYRSRKQKTELQMV